MSIVPPQPGQLGEAEETRSGLTPDGSGSARGVLAWSSFFFALLQSICTFFGALNGLRVVIGVGSLALSATVSGALGEFHHSWVRLPMIVLALAGALLNLLVLWQVRRLRNRPASRWRQQPLSPHKIRMERLQLALSIATLALVAVEEYLHLLWHHHL